MISVRFILTITCKKLFANPIKSRGLYRQGTRINTSYLIEINDEMELGLQETFNSLGGIAHQELKGYSNLM